MAQHGYLHDEYDRSDFGRGDDDRERSWRDRDDERSWRGRDEDRNWRSSNSDSDRSRERGSVFGGWSDQDRYSANRNRDHGDDRGFFDRAGSEMKSWFHDDDNRGQGQWQDRSHDRGSWSGQQRGYGSSRDQSDYGRGREQSAFSSQGRQGEQRYSAHPDDHYRSWRDKQMQSLDRDYQDYCREREQQFHSDFDTWRQNRQSQGQNSGENSGQSWGQANRNESSNSALELNQEVNRGGEIEGATSSPMSAATMGTNNSENDASAPSATGRGKR